jgi:hypothetical protein
MAKKNKLEVAHAEVEARKRWLEERGLTVDGYIRLYGDPDKGSCYGCGGRVIWASDVAALIGSIARLRHLKGDPKGINGDDIMDALLFTMGRSNPLTAKQTHQ